MSRDSEAIYLLAFDHRGSFQKKLLGIAGEPTPSDVARITEAKAIIFAGFRQALDSGLPLEGAGILVDETFGAEIAREALELGAQLAMPVEKSGQDEFDFEYGDAFGDHIDAFDPTYAKVLVRYNPEGDAELNRAAGGAARAPRRLAPRERPQVPVRAARARRAAPARAVGGDQDRYDRELRPDLMIEAIRELPGRRRRAGHLEDRGARRPRRLRARGRRGARRRPRSTSGASCSAAAATRARSCTGCGQAPACPASSASPSAGRSGGTRSRTGSAGRAPTGAAETIAANYRRLVDAYAAAEIVAHELGPLDPWRGGRAVDLRRRLLAPGRAAPSAPRRRCADLPLRRRRRPLHRRDHDRPDRAPIHLRPRPRAGRRASTAT